MISLYFLRHGQTEWNLSGKFQGSTDVALSPLGIRQADAAAAWFDDVRLDAIYTSPLTRARMTARKVAERKNLPLVEMPDFRELCFGEWEGLTYEEINTRWPGAIDALYKKPDGLRIPGGETFDEAEARTMRGLREILASGDGENFLIVSHGAAIRTMLCGLLDLPLRMSWNLCQGNAAISRVDHYGEGMNWLYLLNSQEHLKTMHH